jgi:hypothetical protein
MPTLARLLWFRDLRNSGAIQDGRESAAEPRVTWDARDDAWQT